MALDCALHVVDSPRRCAPRNDGKTYTSSVTNTYGTGAAHRLGALVSATSVDTVTGQSTKTSSTTNTYVWRDSALLNVTTFDSDTSTSANALWTTTNTYNGLGQLAP